MKKIGLLIAAVALITACQKENEESVLLNEQGESRTAQVGANDYVTVYDYKYWWWDQATFDTQLHIKSITFEPSGYTINNSTPWFVPQVGHNLETAGTSSFTSSIFTTNSVSIPIGVPTSATIVIDRYIVPEDWIYGFKFRLEEIEGDMAFMDNYEVYIKNDITPANPLSYTIYPYSESGTFDSPPFALSITCEF